MPRPWELIEGFPPERGHASYAERRHKYFMVFLKDGDAFLNTLERL